MRKPLLIFGLWWTAILLHGLPELEGQTRDAGPSTVARVLVTVSSEDAEPISRDGLVALIDGDPVEIRNVSSAKDEPLVFTILIDISGSSRDKQSFERKASAELFGILAIGANIGYFGDFNDELYLSHKPASADSIEKEFRAIGQFRGGSALYDATLQAARLINRAGKDARNRRAVIILTDGQDNASSLGLKEAVKQLEREAVPIFCVGLVGAQPDKKSIDAMQEISDSTGGFAFFPTGPQDITPMLLEKVQNQYWVELAVPLRRDGKLHSVTIKPANSKVRITAPVAISLR